MLETVLSDGTNPPPSVHELAKQFGFDVARLRRQFPDLCAKIAKNYRIYRKALGAMRVQRIYEDVKDTVMLLSTQGCYPSITKVRKILFEKKYWIKDVNDAWRKVMLELGFDDCAEQNL